MKTLVATGGIIGNISDLSRAAKFAVINIEKRYFLFYNKTTQEVKRSGAYDDQPNGEEK